MGKPIYVKWATMGKLIWIKWANEHDAAQLQIETIPQNFKQRKSLQQFEEYAFWSMFCTTSSFVHHFKPTGEFKLEL